MRVQMSQNREQATIYRSEFSRSASLAIGAKTLLVGSIFRVVKLP